MMALMAELLLAATTFALFATVFYKMLSGDINTTGLFSDKVTGDLSPGRLQLVLVTIGGAAYYLVEVLAFSDPGRLPPAPEPLLWVASGSNAGYLGGKWYSAFRP